MKILKNNKAFTLTEILIGLFLILIVGAFAVIAGYRFMKRNAEAKYESVQWESVQGLRKRLSNLIEGSVYISTRETPGPNELYGISSDGLQGNYSNDDYIQLYAYPEGSTGVSYTVTQPAGSCNGSGCRTIRLLDKNNPNPGSPYLGTGQFLYLSTPTATYLVKVTQTSLNNEFDIRPPQPALPQFGNGIKPIAARVEPITLYTAASSSAGKDLKLFRGTFDDLRQNNNPPRGDTLVSSLNRFQIFYTLKQKRTQNRQDNCSCGTDPRRDDIRNFRRIGNDWLLSTDPSTPVCGGCNFNNLMRITVEMDYYIRKERTPENLKSESFSTSAPRFDPQNWGNFSSLNLSGPATACDDRFESQRCLPECVGRYTNRNSPFLAADFEPGSNYCTCKGANFDWNQIARDDTRYGACCALRDTLVDRATGNTTSHLNDPSNPDRSNASIQCRFQYCDGVTRGDNPWLSLCYPANTCGGAVFSRACSWPQIPNAAGICNPAGGAGNGGQGNFYPPNSSLVTLQTVMQGQPAGTPPPTVNGGGAIISGPYANKILVRNDNPVCECYRQLYPAGGGNRTINVPGNYGNIYPPAGGSSSASWTSPAQLPGGAFNGFEPGTQQFHDNPTPAAVTDDWRVCWDSAWDSPSGGGGGGSNPCQFTAHVDGNNQNVIDQAPYDPGNFWWWASAGRAMPGNRSDSTEGQFFMVRCAAERGGLPHDPNATFLFNGFNAKLSNEWTNSEYPVPTGRDGVKHASCIDPSRAAGSQVNIDYFANLPTPVTTYEARLAAIQATCPVGGGGGGGPQEGEGGL